MKFFSLVNLIMIIFNLLIFISYLYFVDSFKKQTPFLFLVKQNYHDKKIITLSPGGFRGFYVLGLCKFIKENYDLKDYVFSGASAGAWNSLFLSYNGNSDKFVNSVMSVDIKKQNSLYNVQQSIKETLLEFFDETEFDFQKLYIGTTIIKDLRFRPIIYSDFNNLEDAIDCCIASSHIPFITGGFKYNYRGINTYDGGFVKFPYLNNEYSSIHITPSIWNTEESTFEKIKRRKKRLSDYSTLFNKNGHNIKELYLDGYKDAEENKEKLNKIFNKENT